MTTKIDHLQALLAKGLTQEEETLARRYYSDKDRESMDESDFCGPHQSFPVLSQEDVNSAAHLVGHADDPESVKSCIIRKAKANGWSLPESWQEKGEQERSSEGIQVKMDPNQLLTGINREMSISMPLVRIDANKREVWGQATAEVPDSYGTIFGYYPKAWQDWRGNVREQHDGKKAVGRRIDLECNDMERAIYVGSRVSRGAQDTWFKVEDNVLTGYSASIIPDPEFGHDISKWPKKAYNGKEYPYLPRYTVAELSLVDNPACPGCNIAIVRADGFATEVLDLTEEESTPPEAEPASSAEPLERAGARLSADSRSALHDMRDKAMALCGCDECMGMQGSSESDGDAEMERAITGIVERILEKQLSAVYVRLQGIAGTLARSNANTSLENLITSAITRAVETTVTANSSSLAEVRADLSAVKETVERIDKTPVPGAPINTGALPRPAGPKTLATDPYQAPKPSGSAVFDALSRMSEAGLLDTPERQADAVAAGFLAQQRGRR